MAPFAGAMECGIEHANQILVQSGFPPRHAARPGPDRLADRRGGGRGGGGVAAGGRDRCGKRDAKVCVRVQGRGSTPTSTTVTTWSTTMPQILRLRDQLVESGVELAVVESTSDYWRPFFYVLSEAVPVMLVKASDVKGMPGRKSDVSDAEWLADLAAHGLVRASFVPAEPMRQLRDLTRARVGLFEERTRELQRLEKELEDACIKLSAVVSDLAGVSARSMLEALIGHESDPATLANLAKGRMRSKIDQLTEALTGRFNDHHRFMVGFRLSRIDQTTAEIDELDRRIEQVIENARTW